MGRSDSLPPVSPHFVAFVWRYHRCVLFAPSGRDVGRGLWGVVIPGPEPEIVGGNASGCWPSFAGRDSFTRRVAMKGFPEFRVSFSFLELA